MDIESWQSAQESDMTVYWHTSPSRCETIFGAWSSGCHRDIAEDIPVPYIWSTLACGRHRNACWCHPCRLDGSKGHREMCLWQQRRPSGVLHELLLTWVSESCKCCNTRPWKCLKPSQGICVVSCEDPNSGMTHKPRYTSNKQASSHQNGIHLGSAQSCSSWIAFHNSHGGTWTLCELQICWYHTHKSWNIQQYSDIH